MRRETTDDRQALRVWGHRLIPSVSCSNCSTDLLLPLSHTEKWIRRRKKPLSFLISAGPP